MKKTLLIVQKALLIIGTAILNLPFSHKVIEYGFPTPSDYEIDDVARFVEFYQPTAYTFFVLVFFLSFVANYNNRFRDLLLVIINMGLILSCTSSNMKLNFVGIGMLIVSLISLSVLHYKTKEGLFENNN